MAEPKQKGLLSLFTRFFRFGCFTFGGGWSIVAQMQQSYVEEEQLLTSQELLDLTSVGKSIPGTMIGNVAVMFGYRVRGVLGGLVCLLGMILPPFVILCFITLGYTAFRSNPWVNAAMQGIRCAVVPIILTAVLSMVKGAFQYRICIGLSVVAFVLYAFFHVSAVALVVLGGICGFLICEFMERKHDLA